MRRRRELLSLVSALACLNSLGHEAQAALVKTSFAGTVTSNNTFVGTPAIGSAISGSFTFDPSNTAGVGDNCIGTPFCWSDSHTSWELNGLSFPESFFTNQAFFGVTISIIDHPPGTGVDSYIVSLSGDSFTTVELRLTDTSGGAFEAASNPLIPSLSSFDGRDFRYHPLCLTGISCATNPFYDAVVTSMTSAPVPEPGTLLLLGSGFCSLVAFHRRAQRTRRSKSATTKATQKRFHRLDRSVLTLLRRRVPSRTSTW